MSGYATVQILSHGTMNWPSLHDTRVLPTGILLSAENKPLCLWRTCAESMRVQEPMPLHEVGPWPWQDCIFTPATMPCTVGRSRLK